MPFSADELIDRFEETESTFRIPTSDDPEQDLICKVISDVREMTQVRLKAQSLLKSWNAKTVLPEWLPYGPITQDVASIVATLTLVVLEPKFTDLQALKLCKKAGPAAAQFYADILRHTGRNMPQREMDAMEAEKNGLSPIGSTESTSQSDTNISESIPTTSAIPTGSEPEST